MQGERKRGFFLPSHQGWEPFLKKWTISRSKLKARVSMNQMIKKRLCALSSQFLFLQAQDNLRIYRRFLCDITNLQNKELFSSRTDKTSFPPSLLWHCNDLHRIVLQSSFLGGKTRQFDLSELAASPLLLHNDSWPVRRLLAHTFHEQYLPSDVSRELDFLARSARLLDLSLSYSTPLIRRN